jgi:hypothetical protein
MEPITHHTVGRDIFAVLHDHTDLWLNADYGHPRRFWYADGRFVFVRPGQKQ